MKRLQQVIMSLAIVLGITVTAIPQPVSAIDTFKDTCSAQQTNDVCKAVQTDNATNMIKTVIDTLLTILGIVAVIMIIIGAFRYVLSAGDAAAIKMAKNTIFYAIIGLIIAILAFVIVNYVVTTFK